MAVADYFETFENCLPLVIFNHAGWIRWQWVEMFLKKCASEFLKVRRNGRQGNMRPASHLGEHASKMPNSNLSEVPNTTFMVVIRWVSNGKDMVQAPKQLQA